MEKGAINFLNWQHWKCTVVKISTWTFKEHLGYINGNVRDCSHFTSFSSSCWRSWTLSIWSLCCGCHLSITWCCWGLCSSLTWAEWPWGKSMTSWTTRQLQSLLSIKLKKKKKKILNINIISILGFICNVKKVKLFNCQSVWKPRLKKMTSTNIQPIIFLFGCHFRRLHPLYSSRVACKCIAKHHDSLNWDNLTSLYFTINALEVPITKQQTGEMVV